MIEGVLLSNEGMDCEVWRDCIIDLSVLPWCVNLNLTVYMCCVNSHFTVFGEWCGVTSKELALFHADTGPVCRDDSEMMRKGNQ